MRGRSESPCCLWTCEQMTSHVRHPMHSVGSGKITPLERGGAFGVPPAARLPPPMASKAMNAPTAAVAPFRTSRRVAPLSPAGVAPLVTIGLRFPPSPASTTSNHHTLDQCPKDCQPAEGDDIRTDG